MLKKTVREKMKRKNKAKQTDEKLKGRTTKTKNKKFKTEQLY